MVDADIFAPNNKDPDLYILLNGREVGSCLLPRSLLVDASDGSLRSDKAVMLDIYDTIIWNLPDDLPSFDNVRACLLRKRDEGFHLRGLYYVENGVHHQRLRNYARTFRDHIIAHSGRSEYYFAIEAACSVDRDLYLTLSENRSVADAVSVEPFGSQLTNRVVDFDSQKGDVSVVLAPDVNVVDRVPVSGEDGITSGVSVGGHHSVASHSRQSGATANVLGSGVVPPHVNVQRPSGHASLSGTTTFAINASQRPHSGTTLGSNIVTGVNPATGGNITGLAFGTGTTTTPGIVGGRPNVSTQNIAHPTTTPLANPHQFPSSTTGGHGLVPPASDTHRHFGNSTLRGFGNSIPLSHGGTTGPNGVTTKRYSWQNVPGSARKTKPPVMIATHHSQSASERYTSLVLLTETRIPQARHRNVSPIAQEDVMDRKRPLLWWSRFEIRCYERGIYCPHWKGFDVTSCMGTEWELGNLPDGIYDRHQMYKTALKVDLLFVCSRPQDKDLSELVSGSVCGFSALYNLMSLLCKVFTDDLVNQDLLVWKSGVSIPAHIGNVQEFILQSAVVGATYTSYKQWLMCIKFLPVRIMNALLVSGDCLIQGTVGCDKVDNLPYEMHLVNAAQYIMRVMDLQGYTLPTSVKSSDGQALQPDPVSGMMAVSSRPLKCWGCGKNHHISDCTTHHIVPKQPSPYDARPLAKSAPPQAHRAHRSDRQVNGVTWQDDESPSPATSDDTPGVESGEDGSTPLISVTELEDAMGSTLDFGDVDDVAGEMLGIYPIFWMLLLRQQMLLILISLRQVMRWF